MPLNIGIYTFFLFDLTCTRPPVIPSNSYFVAQQDSETLIPEEEYISLYESGALTKMHVSQPLIKKLTKQQTGELDKQGDQPVLSFIPLAKAPSALEANPNLDVSIARENDKDDENEVMEDKIKVMMREFQSSFLKQVHSH